MTNQRALTAILVATLIFLLSPILVVVVASFNNGAIMSFPPTSFSTHWYHEIKPVFYDAIWTSFVVATGATTISVIVGVPAALALCRGLFPGRELISSLCLSPLMVPALVTGVALYQCSLILWDFTGITLGGTLTGIVLGHLTYGIPFVIRAVIAGHTRFDSALEEAAQNLGAPPLKTFWLVTLPLLKPAIISGAILAFAMSFDDVPIALFMGGGDATTLPVRIYTTVQFDLSGDVMAVATLVVAGTLALIALLNHLVGSEFFISTKQ